MMAEGVDPEALVEAQDLRQVDDRSALERHIQDILADHPDEVGRYRDGKKGLIGFFMGRVMDRTDGTANPEVTRQLLQEQLEE